PYISPYPLHSDNLSVRFDEIVSKASILVYEVAFLSLDFHWSWPALENHLIGGGDVRPVLLADRIFRFHGIGPGALLDDLSLAVDSEHGPRSGEGPGNGADLFRDLLGDGLPEI